MMTLWKIAKVVGPIPAAFFLGYFVWKKLNT